MKEIQQLSLYRIQPRRPAQSFHDSYLSITGFFFLMSVSLAVRAADAAVVAATATMASHENHKSVDISWKEQWEMRDSSEMYSYFANKFAIGLVMVALVMLTGAVAGVVVQKDTGTCTRTGTRGRKRYQQDMQQNDTENDQVTKENTSSTYHAHFDCFSGAAGDMMLASCIDASSSLSSWSPRELLSKIEHDLKKGIPELENEFQLKCFKVWRGGMGSIAALKVEVESLYQHKPAPVPTRIHEGGDEEDDEEDVNGNVDDDEEDEKDDQSKEHDHDDLFHEGPDGHSHEHSHGHPDEHSHEHTHNHSTHDHSHNHSTHDHSHEHSTHDHSHDHTHDYSHNHTHGHSHSHKSPSASGPLRNLPQIKQMLIQSSEEYIPASVARLAIQTFTELAIAESFTHGTSSPDSVHFHEVGAIDSIVDVIGTLLALHHLKVETVSCSRLPMGEGTVWTDHGQLPVPAFATMRLMMGMKTCPGPGNSCSNGGREGTTMDGSTVTGELVTPTAAALLRVLTGVADMEGSKQPDAVAEVRVGRPPSFTPRAIGLGAGTKDFVKFPNVVRLVIGDDVSLQDGSREQVDQLCMPLSQVKDTDKYISEEEEEEVTAEKSTLQYTEWNVDNLTLLQANIDDITAEVLSYAMDLLLTNGAIDVWVEPIVMKKGRSAHCLNCLYHSNSSDFGAKLMKIIFCHTTTLGIRIQRDIERASLDRKLFQVNTKYGQVNIKVGYMEGKTVSAKAEYEDCKKICNATGIPIKIIADAAVQTFQQEYCNAIK